MYIMRKTPLLIILLFLASVELNAQLVKEKSIDVSVGIGISFPYENIDVFGSGFYLQGEYVHTLDNWIEFRPYSSLILTKTNQDFNKKHGTDFKSTANAFMVGAKARIIAPIPWVAPYVEIGVGVSVGSFEIVTQFTNKEKNGMILHIPWSIGLKIGPDRNYDIAFSYYEHPEVKQIVGAISIGFSFPLKSTSKNNN